MKPQSSPAAKAEYDEVAAVLESTGATRGSMFGMPCLKVGTKAFAGLFGDAMTFKLGPEPRTKALELPGAELFDPAGKGRPMKEWVVVPLDQAPGWPGWAAEALEYVRE